MSKRVGILGGGVAGLTAAQELVERGFSVDVYEASDDVGGKARSQPALGTGAGGRRDLPGEHGFRFFPSFYRHLRDTMGRIPLEGGGFVEQRLVPSQQMAMAERRGLFVFQRSAPRDVRELFQLTETVRDFFARTGVSERDTARFAMLMWQFLVSCEPRRVDEYEPLSFWQFIRGDEYAPSFQKYLDTPRFMVAMDPRRGSARTIASKALQILLDFFRNGTRTDAVLDGPTSERWLEPWRAYLAREGVRFHLGKAVSALDVAAGVVRGAHLSDGAVARADHYVLAVPLERAAALVTAELAQLEPELARVRELAPCVAWMVGVQFFLRRTVEVCRGHVAYPDSDWSLSSVSQGQFWSAPAVAQRFGDGEVCDVLSVDVSDWFEPSTALGKRACDCTRDELVEEVWRQLKEGLGDALRREDVVHVHVDRNVTFGPSGAENATPLLVHPPRSLASRPGAVLSRIRNLFLASDYVRTNTDLASMEGANEAARRAVNGILRREGRPRDACELWSMEEEAGPAVSALRAADLTRYRAGAPTVVELAARDVLGASVDEGVSKLGVMQAVERELAIQIEWLLR